MRKKKLLLNLAPIKSFFELLKFSVFWIFFYIFFPCFILAYEGSGQNKDNILFRWKRQSKSNETTSTQWTSTFTPGASNDTWLAQHTVTCCVKKRASLHWNRLRRKNLGAHNNKRFINQWERERDSLNSLCKCLDLFRLGPARMTTECVLMHFESTNQMCIRQPSQLQ